MNFVVLSTLISTFWVSSLLGVVPNLYQIDVVRCEHAYQMISCDVAQSQTACTLCGSLWPSRGVPPTADFIFCNLKIPDANDNDEIVMELRYSNADLKLVHYLDPDDLTILTILRKQ